MNAGDEPMAVTVHPHPTGEWLVIVGQRRLGVPPEIGRRLRSLEGCGATTAELGRRLGCGEAAAAALRGPARRGRRRPWWVLPVLPPEMVRRGAALLAPVASARRLAALAVAGCCGLALGAGAPAAGGTGVTWAVGVVLFILSALLHELGHAAALHRAGYPPGGIGVGLLFALPVLWCDVTAVALLPPGRRVAVDLAGPAVQMGCAGALALAGGLPGVGAAARLAAGGALLAVVWSVLPFLRTDGFWVLSDLAGIGPLDRRPVAADDRRARWLLAGHALGHALFLGGMAVAAWRRGQVAEGPLAAVAQGTAVLLGLAGLLRLVPILTARTRRAAAP